MAGRAEASWGSAVDVESLKRHLEAQSFAVLCVGMDLGQGVEPILIVKSSRDLLDSLRAAGAAPEAAWLVHRTDLGPVICLVVRAQAEGVGLLAGETYFDPAGRGDRELLRSLTSRPRLRVVFLDEDLELEWPAEIPWDEVRRLETEQVIDRAEELLESVRSYDFLKAKESFQETFPLDQLLAKAFSQ
jgi:hypothetical protein